MLALLICPAQFFGELSPFQLIVALVAFLTGGYTFYKSALERARVRVYTGDHVDIASSALHVNSYVNILCNFANHSAKTGTVHRMELNVTDPDGETKHTFVWSLFYGYVRGGYAVVKETDAYPVALPAHSAKPVFIQFEQVPLLPDPKWTVGQYRFELLGWVNRSSRTSKANLKSAFTVEVTDVAVKALKWKPGEPPKQVSVPIIEWAIDRQFGLGREPFPPESAGNAGAATQEVSEGNGDS